MNPSDTQLAKANSSATAALYRQATDVAGLCRELALKKALTIGTRRFLPVEVWTTIAVAHGFIASIKEGSVKEVYRGDKLIGIQATAELKRQSDGAVLSTAEGFVGDDEVDWFGSHGEPIKKWSKRANKEVEMVIAKREDYAIRAMAQTRAVSRVCRTGFSHVVVMIDEKLSTTPYEEIANDSESVIEAETITPKSEGASAGTETKKPAPEVPREETLKLRAQFEGGKWQAVVLHFGKNKGTKLGVLEKPSLKWYADEWQPKPFGNKPVSQDDTLLRAALDVAAIEMNEV